MKQFAFYSIVILILSACNGTNSANSEPLQKDSVDAQLIDTTSDEGFIQSICDFRKQKEYTTAGFEISGTTLLSGPGGFKIYNFMESFDDYNLNTQYAITLNQFDSKTAIQSGKEVFIQLEDLLNKSQISYTLYEGNFEKTLDLKRDGSLDYILKDERIFRDNTFASERVYIYDGLNALLSTEIKATSDFTEGEDGLSGIKEKLEIKEQKKRYPLLTVHHESIINYENSKGGMEETTLKFRQSWQWTPTRSEWEPGEWLTGLICDYSACQELVSSLTEKQTKLSSEYEGFAIVEECFKGQPDFFQLSLYEDDFSSYYVTKDNADDVGSTVVLHAIIQGTSTLILYTGRVEKFTANITGTPHFTLDLQKHIITKEISAYDQEIEAHRYNDENAVYYYTRNAGYYPYIECASAE
jgi:hypothetical protein